MQISGKISVLKDGPFVVNVSAEQTMVVVNELITGLAYTFSVRYQNLILTQCEQRLLIVVGQSADICWIWK